jgi:FKBP-type peptidyl-prolyl cis-trans isomerase FkpA
MLRNLLFLLILMLSLPACGEKKQETEKAPEPVPGEQLIEANRKAMRAESREIDAYIKKQGWEMQTSGTGLRYSIQGKTEGEAPSKDSRVRIKYTLRLLDGTVCYASLTERPHTVQLGQGQLPNGAEEGLMKMKEGNTAVLVLPSHLGYGLTGDSREIPPMSALVYTIELIEIQ